MLWITLERVFGVSEQQEARAILDIEFFLFKADLEKHLNT